MSTEPSWIGHPSARRRMLRDGGYERYEYLDPENQSLALMLGMQALHPIGLLFAGANLWEIDRFVEGLESAADPRAERFRAVLNKIRSTFTSADLSGDIATNAAWDLLRALADDIVRAMSGWTEPDGTNTPPSKGSDSPAVHTHRLRTRSNPLTAVIEKAKGKAADPDDYLSVWSVMTEMARSADRPAPLVGYADGAGVQWRNDDGDVRFLTKDALRKRMNPSAR